MLTSRDCLIHFLQFLLELLTRCANLTPSFSRAPLCVTNSPQSDCLRENEKVILRPKPESAADAPGTHSVAVPVTASSPSEPHGANSGSVNPAPHRRDPNLTVQPPQPMVQGQSLHQPGAVAVVEIASAHGGPLSSPPVYSPQVPGQFSPPGQPNGVVQPALLSSAGAGSAAPTASPSTAPHAPHALFDSTSPAAAACGPEVAVLSHKLDQLAMRLRICLNGANKDIKFPFDLAVDTADTVAAEMIAALGLDSGQRPLISQRIDDAISKHRTALAASAVAAAATNAAISPVVAASVSLVASAATPVAEVAAAVPSTLAPSQPVPAVTAQASSSTLPEAATVAPVLSPTPAPVVAPTTVAAIPDASVAVETKVAPESAAPAAVAAAAAAASSAAVATTADARPKALDSSDRDRDRADAKNSASSSSDTSPTVDDLQVHYEQQIRARMHEKPILELLRICQVTRELFAVFLSFQFSSFASMRFLMIFSCLVSVRCSLLVLFAAMRRPRCRRGSRRRIAAARGRARRAAGCQPIAALCRHCAHGSIRVRKGNEEDAIRRARAAQTRRRNCQTRARTHRAKV
jgi:hypothetical protein